MDENLPPRPISLHYSGQPGGPWSLIAAALENSGQYTWPIDHRVPDQIYLRLDVHDAAGNTSVVETSQPTLVPRPHPTGRLRSVRPVDQPAQQTATRP
ncbi:MAG: hypothetical protein A2W31_11225 [Planctomycetes bacterium RBG_16_64_10]|nr:MAG: hypothetical protein A2W31_11225 [Planctomycetes bacterium RBG_16_64_10]